MWQKNNPVRIRYYDLLRDPVKVVFQFSTIISSLETNGKDRAVEGRE